MKAKIKYHDGASRLERHGAMWDMAASETVPRKEDEGSGAEPAGRMTKRKRRQLAPLKPSRRGTRVRCVETGMEFETVKAAGSALAALGLGKDAAVAAAAVSNCMRTGGTAYGFHFVKVAA